MKILHTVPLQYEGGASLTLPKTRQVTGSIRVKSSERKIICKKSPTYRSEW